MRETSFKERLTAFPEFRFRMGELIIGDSRFRTGEKRPPGRLMSIWPIWFSKTLVVGFRGFNVTG